MTNTEALRLLKAGKSTMTFKSIETNVHFTYKVVKSKGSNNLFFCSVLNGPDNYTNYKYFGILTGNKFMQTAKSKIKADATSVKAFNYTFTHLVAGNLSKVEIYHEGKCCKCGRKLTTPESIDRGIGPECWKYYR